MTTRAIWLVALLLDAGGAAAQEYVVRFDTRVQDASYRGILKDSIRAGLAVTAPSGGLQTPDVYAVSCLGGQAFCYFNRIGPARRGGPFVTSADVTAWGFGVRGLSFHANARVGIDLGSSDAWPGTDP